MISSYFIFSLIYGVYSHFPFNNGSTGPQGPQGETPTVTIGSVSSGDTADVTGNNTETGISLDFVLPVGPQGLQGEKGDTGAQGPQGSTPTVAVGSVTSGDTASITENDTETGISLDFILPVGPQGPQGEKGDTGAQGPQGEKGDTGAQGPQGEAGSSPDITVSESTPTSYKVTFKTDTQEITSPNLKVNPECYNVNLSATGSSTNIPIGKLILTYQNTSATSIRFSVRAADAAVPILADIRRTSIYDGSSIESQTNNNATISGTLVIDDLIYSMSQEMHWTRIRQQDPDSGLWSMCEVRTFASQGGARTSVCVEWFYTNASFQTP